MCYLCRYEEAVQSYATSLRIDPLLRSAERAGEEVARFLERVCENVTRKVSVKSSDNDYGDSDYGLLCVVGVREN